MDANAQQPRGSEEREPTGSEAGGVERSAIRKVAIRIVPFVALMFFINYLDRTAIGFAGPNGMNDDLALSAAQFGFASGVFFVGYILLEVPSNIALYRYGARRWLARIMVSWGLVAALFTVVQDFTQLAALRVLLGVAEAGFFPGAILFLSLWVPVRHRGRILALFYLAQPLTTVLGAPMAGWLVDQHGLFFGLEGWRFMFFCVALPAIVVGVIAWFYLAEKPADVKWLTEAEKRWLTAELDADRANAERRGDRGHGRRPSTRSAFGNGRVWALAFVYFGLIYGLYSLAFFLPTIIAGFEDQYATSLSLVQEGLVTAIPYLAAAVVLYLWARDATRRGVRYWHIALPAAVGAVSVPLAQLVGSPVGMIALITVTAGAIFAALPNFWTLPTQFLTSVAAAAGIALINTVGNLAGFTAPYVTGVLHDLTGTYLVPMLVVGGLMLMSAVLMMVLAARGEVGESARRPEVETGRHDHGDERELT